MPAAQSHSVKQLGILHYYALITLTRPFRENFASIIYSIKTFD